MSPNQPSLLQQPHAAADFALMLLADARLPIGGHSQSAGLEPALMGGMPVGDLPAYLVTRLRTTALVDAGTAVLAWAVLAEGPGSVGSVDDGLARVEAHWAARTPSHPQREAARLIGRGGLRILERLWPDHRAVGSLRALGAPSRPLVVGALGAVIGLSDRQVAALVCYDEVQTVTSAALKLAPLDPLDAVGWAVAARTEVAAVVAAVVGLRDPEDLPAPAAPLLDLWVHHHAHQTRRLFRA